MGMVVDVSVVKNHIKPKADSTLSNMRKAILIEHIRTLEHNYNVAVSFNENQARYIESLGIKEVVRCGECKFADTVDCPMSGSAGRVSASDFCSYGERRTDERKAD